MTEAVSFTTHGAIAEAVIDNPPVNATSAAVRTGLDRALDRFAADPGLEVLILRCAGRTFVAGADIKEFGKPMVEPRLNQVMGKLEQLAKPVIAAVHGSVLGGGLELAQACDYRIAAPDTKFGFPEVKLGLTTGAGGAQRTLRLAGLTATIDLLTSGRAVGADEAVELGLIDRIAEGDLADAARVLAQEIASSRKGRRRARDLPLPDYDEKPFEEARKAILRRQRGQPAPLLALDTIELAYRMPFEAALEREYATCLEAMASPQSKALRHVFAAEREVARIPGLADVSPRPVAQAGVIGLGPMGRGIAMAMAAAGVPVTVVGLDQAQVDQAMGAIAKMWSASVSKGSLAQAEMDRRLALIAPTTSPEALADADLIVEAVTEDMAIKSAVFEKLGEVARPGAILASNTSYLDIDALAAASRRPADVCGMHFFNPAHVMRLLENVRGAATAPDVVATIMDFGRRIGKLPILSGVCDGFIVNRMLAKRSRESYFLLEEGAAPAAIDKVVVDFGFPMGPYALADLAGIDVQYAARQARRQRLTPREIRADFVDRMYARGRFGQKSGAGWYAYGEDRKPAHDPETDRIIAAHAEAHGLTRREIAAEEIQERLLYAMVNEGARILDEGVAPRPHEIDVAMINGLGFPAHTGGPMFWADQIGLPTVLAAIERFRGEHGDDYWTPAPLLVRLAQENRGFYP